MPLHLTVHMVHHLQPATQIQIQTEKSLFPFSSHAALRKPTPQGWELGTPRGDLSKTNHWSLQILQNF